MAGQVAILWTPAGVSLDRPGGRQLVDLTDGDTPDLRIAVRMLSIDTPETYPIGPRLDAELAGLVPWIGSGAAPIDPVLLLPHELRALERLVAAKRRLDSGDKLDPRERWGWLERHCADMTTRLLCRPRRHVEVAPEDRLFIWPERVREAVVQLGLVPAPSTLAAGRARRRGPARLRPPRRS